MKNPHYNTGKNAFIVLVLILAGAALFLAEIHIKAVRYKETHPDFKPVMITDSNTVGKIPDTVYLDTLKPQSNAKDTH